MACPSFLRRKLTYGIGNKILAPSGGVVYPPSDIQYYYEFNGVDSYGELPTIVPTGDYTVNTSLMVADDSDVMTILSSDNEGDSFWWYINATTGTQVIRTRKASDGEWQYQAFASGELLKGVYNDVAMSYKSGEGFTIITNGVSAFRGTSDIQEDINFSLVGNRGSYGYWDGIYYQLSFSGELSANGQTYSELNYPIIFDNIGDTIVRETINGDAALDGQLINAQNADYIEV